MEQKTIIWNEVGYARADVISLSKTLFDITIMPNMLAENIVKKLGGELDEEQQLELKTQLMPLEEAKKPALPEDDKSDPVEGEQDNKEAVKSKAKHKAEAKAADKKVATEFERSKATFEEIAAHYVAFYPNSKEFHITSDKMVFLAGDLSSARAHSLDLKNKTVKTIKVE